MRKTLKWLLLITIASCCLLLIVAWQNHRMSLQQKLYPMEVFFYKKISECDQVAPEWMLRVLDHSLGPQGGISTQLSFNYLGGLVNCVRGMAAPVDLLIYRPPGVFTKINAASIDMYYRYASMTKLVTANAVLKLESENKLSLDAPLLSFFPEVTNIHDDRVADITLSDLINHQAGFDRTSLAGDPMFHRNRKPWCPYNISQLSNERLRFSPGTKVSYSNLGYCLLGEVIGRVTGLPYKEYIERTYSLDNYGIQFVANEFLANEVAYDYRFETDYNNNYVKQFDFNAIASSAGLLGSAKAFSQLLRDYYSIMPTLKEIRKIKSECDQKAFNRCFYNGAEIYLETEDEFFMLVHEGYLPGAASVAVLDSYGGITVLTKSGANRPQVDSRNHWKPFLYNQLKNYYAEEGLVAKTDHSQH